MASRLPSCLLSPREKLDAVKKNRAEMVRTELVGFHGERVDYALQRKLHKEKQLKDLLSIEEEIRLLYERRKKRFILPSDYKEEVFIPQPTPDIDEDVRLQLQEGLRHLPSFPHRRSERTKDSSSSVLPKSLSPRNPAKLSPMASPKLSLGTDSLHSNSRVSALAGAVSQLGNSATESYKSRNIAGSKETVSDYNSRGKLLKARTHHSEHDRPGPVLNESFLKYSPTRYTEEDNLPATPCPTIDFPRLGSSLSPSTRANRRNVYWKQRVKHDFSPPLESNKAKAVIDIRKAPKEPKKSFRLVRLVDISKQ